MPNLNDYDGLDADDLRERLLKAETVCALFGWTRADRHTPGAEATYEAWVEWLDLVGHDYSSPRAHPDLNEKRIHGLVVKRRATVERTLKNIRATG